MIAAWMVYAVLVAALLGGGALAIELALRSAGRQARWVWVLALAASLVLPVLAVRRAPPPPARDIGVMVAAARVVAAPVPDPSPALVSLDTAFIVGWITTSLVVLVILLRTQWLLRREAAGGEPREMDGHRVCITTRHGPAVVGGLRRATIVLPSWVVQLDTDAQRLAVRHEAEHVVTGDVRLLAVAALAAVAFPWNPAIWWQVRRLRDAVELDCDRRLMRTGVDVHAYGSLLLEVAHHTPLPTMAIALAARPSLLSRRIDHMTPTPSRTRSLRILASAGLGIALVILACEAPRPVTEADRTSGSITEPILNESQVDQPPILLSHPPMQYPPLLKDAGVQGKVVLEFVVDTTGRVDPSTIVVVSSDQKAFERPAIDVVKGSSYRAGMVDGAPVKVRVRQPVTFTIVGAKSSETQGRTADTMMVFVKQGAPAASRRAQPDSR